jgi:hypothetical protein
LFVVRDAGTIDDDLTGGRISGVRHVAEYPLT